MARALILGGTGAIGRSCAHRLTESGWDVTVTGRNRAAMPGSLARTGVSFLACDRQDHAGLLDTLGALGPAPDLLVDAACYTAADVEVLLPLARDAGSVVLLSSKAVYVDDAGRTVNSDEPADYGGRISESQPTVAPRSDVYFDTREGYAVNKVAAEQAYLDSGVPVSVLRPSKVHGAGARRPREWMYVKRVLDRRPAVILAGRGAGIDHPSAAANIAALIETVAANPAARILNAADPDSPTVLEITRAIAGHLGHKWEEILLDDERSDDLGENPWQHEHPIVLDMSAALALGYQPAGGFAQTVAEEIDWLVTAVDGGEDAELVPAADDEFFARLLDYTVEDAYLRARA